MRIPESLKAGDTVRIVAPAGRVSIGDMEFAMTLFSKWGLNVEMGRNMFKSKGMFSSTDEDRLADFQDAFDDRNVKAIFCARGGYGTNRIIDKLDFSAFELSPKWVVGFSDITVLHSHIHKVYGIESIHGAMPKSITEKSSQESMETLRRALFEEGLSYSLPGNAYNCGGSARGLLVGGNLSILYSLTGTPSEPDYIDKVLFIEEIGEYQYHLDRMLVAMKRAGVFDKIKGLIVGHMTDIKDPDPGIGKSVEEMILEHVVEHGFPVIFGFPAGHESDNRALVISREVEIIVGKSEAEVNFIEEVSGDNQVFSGIRMFVAVAIMAVFFVLIWLLYGAVLKK